MNPTHVKSKRRKRSGWRFRFTDPVRRVRTYKTFWFKKRQVAQQAFDDFLRRREARKIGVPDHGGWEMSYDDLVTKFLAEAPIPSERRRKSLKYELELNLLKIQVGADLAEIGGLTVKCRKLLETKRDCFVIKCVQQPLKQLAAWAASIGLFPYNPIAAWKKLPRKSEARRRRAFHPDEIRAILAAATEMDGMLNRSIPSAMAFKTLLVTGNRPGAVFRATVGDLKDARLMLPPGHGNKRNGMATLPAQFVAELNDYVALREEVELKDPLLVSHKGKQIDGLNIGDDFKRCLALAFVRMEWPADDEEAEQVDPFRVSYIISMGTPRGFDGGPPTKGGKKAIARANQIQLEEAVANKIRNQVEKRLAGTDLYCLRKTHVSWARRLVNAESVRLQVGHAPRDIEERHYLDMVDASVSSQAVWDVLNEKRDLFGEWNEQAEKAPVSEEKCNSVAYNVDYTGKNEPTSPKIDLVNFAQYLSRERVKQGVIEGIRTPDLLSHSQTL